MKVEATVGAVTVAVEGGVVTLKNGKGEISFEAGAHKEVSKMITRLLRVNKPVVKVEGAKKGKRSKESVSSVSA